MKTIILLESVLDTFEENLTNEQIGEFVLQLNRWRKGDEPEFTDPILMGLWLGVKYQYGNMKTKWVNQVNNSRENGKKGGRPRKNNNQENPLGFTETHNNPENLKEKEKEREKDKEKEREKENNFKQLLEYENLITDYLK